MPCYLDMVLWGSALNLEHSYKVSRRPSVLALSWASDVIDLQDHLDYLSSQQDLLLLANQGFNHVLLLHVCTKKTTDQHHTALLQY